MVRGKSVRLSKKSSRRGSRIKKKSLQVGDSENLGNLDEIKKQGDIIAKKFEQLLKKNDVKDAPDVKKEIVKGESFSR